MRVLYLAHRVPYPPDKGDRIRNWNVLKQLADHAEVSLATLGDEPVASETEAMLKSVCEKVHIAKLSKWGSRFRMMKALASGQSLSEAGFDNRELTNVVQQWHGKQPFDACVISASSLVPYVRQFANDCPVIVDVVDVDSQKWLDFADSSRGLKRCIYKLEGRRVRKVERDLADWASAVTLVSDAETSLFNRIVNRECATTATNGVDLNYFAVTPPTTGSKTVIAFSGAMDYLPNIDAVTWFVREIWPQVNTNAEFRIIGRNPSPAVMALKSIPGITVSGSVPDVRPHLADASIVVVPMRLSRGLQNKVLEALAMGKAVIASPPALAALSTVHDEHLLRAESNENWIHAIDQLRDNSEKRSRLGLNGRAFVEEHHNWSTCLAPLVESVLRSAEVPA